MSQDQDSQFVHIVRYHHKYGDDIAIYTTSEQAFLGVITEIVLEWSHELPADKEKEVLTLILEKKWDEAIDCYCDFSQEEICLYTREVAPTQFSEEKVFKGVQKRLDSRKEEEDPEVT